MTDTPKYIGIIVQPYHDRPAEMEWVASGEDEELVSAETRHEWLHRMSANDIRADDGSAPFYDIYERKRTSGSNQPPQPPNQPSAPTE